MSTSMLSAVDALTSTKVPLSTFSDANGNVAAGHVTLVGASLSPVSQSNPLPVADGLLAAAIASLATELTGVATAAGQASAQAVLASILTKLSSVNVAGTVAVQDVAAENSLAALAAIASNTSGLATATGQANMLVQETAIAAATGALSDASWNGSGGGSLIAITKAVVSAVQAVANKLGAKLSVQQTDPLPAGTNTIGAVSVNGVVAVQDSATETALAGTLKVAQQGPLPAGTNQIGVVGVAGTIAVQDTASEASLASVVVNTGGIAATAGTSADAAWIGTGSSTLVGLLKALYMKLGGTLSANLVGPLPAGANTIGAVSVSGTVTVQDSATEAALAGTLKVAQQGPLPSGTNQIGSVSVTGTVSVQDVASEAALATISASANGIAAVAGTATDPAWTGTGGSTLVGALKAVYARLSGTLTASVVGSLPPGTNSIGSVSVLNFPTTQPVSGIVGVSGTVVVQDVAAEASLNSMASALSGTLLVQQNSPLPTGANTLGGVQVRNGVTLTQTTVSVTANVDAQLLPSNGSRKSCGFFIVTPGIVGYLNVGNVATAVNGIPFGQGSQFGYGYTWEGSGVPANPVHLISPSNATVIVWEGV